MSSRSISSRLGSVILTGAMISMSFAFMSSARGDSPQKRLLIVCQGPDGHPKNTHEFFAGASVLHELLKPYKDITASVVRGDEPWTEGPELIEKADGIVLFVTQGARWMQMAPERFAALKRLAARGGAIVAIHWSVGAIEGKYIQGQLDLLGATRGGPQRKYRELQTELRLVDSHHPILRGVADIKVFDEMYYSLDQVSGIKPLLTSNIDGKDEMVGWCWERPDKGRSFGFVGLHFHADWQIPDYRRFVVQGVLWSLRHPIPSGGINVEIDPKQLEVNGALPPLPSAPK